MLQFEKYEQYASGILSGAAYDTFGIGEIVNGFLNLIGTTTGAGLNYKAIQDTNDANLKANALTNETNKQIAYMTNLTNLDIAKQNIALQRETNELQVRESEKAFQRSTPAEQIAQLVRAGSSYQRAKMIVEGSGSAAAYPPATLTAPLNTAQIQGATMQSPTLQAPHFDTAGMSNSLGQVASGIESLGADLTNPNGGSLGALAANENVNTVFEHFNDIPDDALTSVDSFQNWYRSSDVQKQFDWLTTEQIDNFNKMFKKANASRSFMYQLRDFQTSYSIKNQVQTQLLNYKSQLIDYHLKELNASWQDANFETMQNLNKQLLEYNVNLSAEEFKSKSAELQYIAEQAKLNLKALQQDGYKEEFIKTFFSDIKLKHALNDAAIVNAQYEKLVGDAKTAFASQFASWIAAYKIFEDCGLMKTNVGVGVATAVGAGKFLVDKANAFNSSESSSSDPLQNAAEAAANGTLILPHK